MVIATLAGATAGDGALWRPAAAPLTTRWTATVRPDRVRPEYPRPLMVRPRWQNLNGIWEFADATGDGAPSGPWRPILVPFTFEAALSGIGEGTAFRENIVYRRSFTVPRAWHRGGGRVLLHFGAVDWEATVSVNGERLGSHRGGYAPFSFDITDALRSGGDQELTVAVYDPADPKTGAYAPKGKQLGSHGIWYTRTTGIWQSVWLEPVPASAIGSLRIDTTDQGELTLLARVTSPDGGLRVRVDLFDSIEPRDFGANPLATGEAAVGTDGTATVRAKWANARLWSPEAPNLYGLRVTLDRGGEAIDTVTSYAGFRGYGIADGRLTLNGRPYFLRGVLDQGYWPDGILTPPTDAALRFDVQATKAHGFNLGRKHVKVEDPRWYYWCDRLGLAVWQDMPSSHNLESDEAKANFRHELSEVIEATRSYPSVLHWIPFNENWGKPEEFQDEMVRMVRGMDPTRPITDASGWTQRDLTDVIDTHNYGNDLLKEGVANPVKPKVVGEFGGIALPIKGHTWTEGWGYQTARTGNDLLRVVRSQVTQLYDAANLSGFVYTQLTDVEQEMNGVLTYDRRSKVSAKKLAAIFEGRDRD